MNKRQLVELLMQEMGLTKVDATRILDCITNAISDTVVKGHKVSIPGFGNFDLKKRKARMALNPLTQEEIQIPAKQVPRFRPAKIFKENANEKIIGE